MDCDVTSMWQYLAFSGLVLQFVFLFHLGHWSMENSLRLRVFLVSLLLSINILAVCQLYCFMFPPDSLFIAGSLSGFTLILIAIGLVWPVIFLVLSGSIFFLSPGFLPVSGRTGNSPHVPSAQSPSRRTLLFWLSLFTSGWILLSGGGSVLAQGGSGASSSPPPSTGTPSTGTPSRPGSGTSRRGPRRIKRPKADKMQIKALSMVGFLTHSVRYIRDSLGPAVIMQLRKLQPAFVALAYGLLVIISLFTLWRMAAESDDASVIPAFILRMIICGVLIGMSSLIVQTLFQVGFIWTSSGAVQDMVGAVELAAPGGGFSMPDTSQTPQLPSGDTDVQITTYELRYLNAIDEWRRNSKERFITGLEAFRQNKLKVRISQSRFFDPKDSGLEYFIPDFSRAGKDGFVHQFLVGLNPKSWSPLQLYSALEASILVMQVGIFTGWILLVFVMPFAELLAPVFFSVAIDKGKLFDQMTMPFIRGLITASLIMPLVNIILEGLAYNIASLGFSVFDIKDGKKGTEVFQWDPATEQIVATADPTVLVFTTCFFILVSGLSLILSPVIAYRIMSGELFGAAVGAISGWTAGLVSLGISAVSQGVGTSFQRQAEHLSNVGNYQSAAASAAASAKAAHIRNGAEYQSTLAQIRQNMATTVNSSIMSLPALNSVTPWLSGVRDTVFSNFAPFQYRAFSYQASDRNVRFSEEELRRIKQNNPDAAIMDGKPVEVQASGFGIFRSAEFGPVTVTDPKLVHSAYPLSENEQSIVGTTARTLPSAAGTMTKANMLLQDPEVAQSFGLKLPPSRVAMVRPSITSDGFMVPLGEAKYLGGVTPSRVVDDISQALQEFHANPGKQNFSVVGQNLTSAQFKELMKYYNTGLSISENTIKEIANGVTAENMLRHDPQLNYELYMASYANTYFGTPYQQWTQIAVAQRNAEFQMQMADKVKQMQDQAAATEYSGQVGAAAITFRYSELAAALRARGQFIQSVTGTVQSVLARQIENNRV